MIIASHADATDPKSVRTDGVLLVGSIDWATIMTSAVNACAAHNAAARPARRSHSALGQGLKVLGDGSVPERHVPCSSLHCGRRTETKAIEEVADLTDSDAFFMLWVIYLCRSSVSVTLPMAASASPANVPTRSLADDKSVIRSIPSPAQIGTTAGSS